jgi:hypothetical protein
MFASVEFVILTYNKTFTRKYIHCSLKTLKVKHFVVSHFTLFAVIVSTFVTILYKPLERKGAEWVSILGTSKHLKKELRFCSMRTNVVV